jgi:hypothetical protein
MGAIEGILQSRGGMGGITSLQQLEDIMLMEVRAATVPCSSTRIGVVQHATSCRQRNVGLIVVLFGTGDPTVDAGRARRPHRRGSRCYPLGPFSSQWQCACARGSPCDG